MRRRAPRPLAEALASAARDCAPQTPLAAVQAGWRTAAGERIAAESEPVAERAGVVTVACRSAVWAHELTLLADDLLGRLNATLEGAPSSGSVRRLRFITGASAEPPASRRRVRPSAP